MQTCPDGICPPTYRDLPRRNEPVPTLKRPAVRADDARAASSLIVDTFLRFKGLERPFVLVTELRRGAISQYSCRMHIALSRATVGVVIVCTPEALGEDGILRALRAKPGVSASGKKGFSPLEPEHR